MSCKGSNNQPVIKFSADSSSIVISNISKADQVHLHANNNEGSDISALVNVLALPGDADRIQDETEVSGGYILKEDSLVFKPNQPFIKNRKYLVESFIGVEFANVTKLVSGTIKQNLVPQKQILKR